MKDLSDFLHRTDFDIGSILAVVDNCATATVLNDLSLFIGKLTLAKNFNIVIVGGSDFKLIHKSRFNCILLKDKVSKG